MRVLTINTTVNSGSHGKIAEQIGELVVASGGESFFAFGRDTNESRATKIKVGSKIDFYSHVLLTRIFDRHGFGSKSATNSLIARIKEILPDIIHLHNIHGYYLNIEVLFKFLAVYNRPVVWTLHDCWSYTGHCAFYSFINCGKWQVECNKCPQIGTYPKSWFLDNSRSNFQIKKELFTSLKKLTLVPVSYWLSRELEKSFLKDIPKSVIHNGIDLTVFRPVTPTLEFFEKYGIDRSKRFILGIANVWEPRKGLADFLILSEILPEPLEIILIGLSDRQLKEIPSFRSIKGFRRTENVMDLVMFYSMAFAFFNPTREDNYPTTILESIACGTPVISYDTGGCRESIDDGVGFIVEKGNFNDVLDVISAIDSLGKNYFLSNCRIHAEANFGNVQKFQLYLDLYKELIQHES